MVGATPYLVVQVGDLLEFGAFWFLLTYVHFSSIFSSRQSHIVISCTIRIWICESLVVYATMNTCELHHQLLHFRYVFNTFPNLFVLFLDFCFRLFDVVYCFLCVFLSFFGFVCFLYVWGNVIMLCLIIFICLWKTNLQISNFV
jgi:hypothetical protein